MMINAPRFGLYILLGVLAAFGQIPWWYSVGLALYDIYLPVTLPWFGHHVDTVDQIGLRELMAARAVQGQASEQKKELMN